MVSLLRLAAGLMAAALLAACSGHKTPEAPVVSQSDQEKAAMAPLVVSYPDVVMGFTVNGSALDVKEAAEGLAWDRTSQDELNEAGLKLWRTTWIAQHPTQHATLTLRFVDYKGPLIVTLTTKA